MYFSFYKIKLSVLRSGLGPVRSGLLSVFYRSFFFKKKTGPLGHRSGPVRSGSRSGPRSGLKDRTDSQL